MMPLLSSYLDQIMAKAPAKDEASGAGVADVLAGKTFWGLTGAAWCLKTGTAAAAQVPRTGQTLSYDANDYSSNPPDGYFDDGGLEKGAAWPSPRFSVNGNGTVTDNLTGLIWLKAANYKGISETPPNYGTTGSANWLNAIKFCHDLHGGHCGLSDGSTAGQWRLPNRRELFSLIDDSRYDPALPAGHPFSDVQVLGYYWSSTTYALNTANAWFVIPRFGFFDYYDKTLSIYVWPVRGGQ